MQHIFTVGWVPGSPPAHDDYCTAQYIASRTNPSWVQCTQYREQSGLGSFTVFQINSDRNNEKNN